MTLTRSARHMPGSSTGRATPHATRSPKGRDAHPVTTAVTSSVCQIEIRPVHNGRDGLVAYASCVYCGIGLNEIAVRRSATGCLHLTYPRKVSTSGHVYRIHWPATTAVSAELEAAIIGEFSRIAGFQTNAGSGP